ncbi:hypothetical protein EDC01DRAFT_635787 [Geopyxis carbonaria]|nr:hypothetical protein EDC01DRAFT_635787 [Geopyxis carbonaria]
MTQPSDNTKMDTNDIAVQPSGWINSEPSTESLILPERIKTLLQRLIDLYHARLAAHWRFATDGEDKPAGYEYAPIIDSTWTHDTIQRILVNVLNHLDGYREHTPVELRCTDPIPIVHWALELVQHLEEYTDQSVTPVWMINIMNINIHRVEEFLNIINYYSVSYKDNRDLCSLWRDQSIPHRRSSETLFLYGRSNDEDDDDAKESDLEEEKWEGEEEGGQEREEEQQDWDEEEQDWDEEEQDWDEEEQIGTKKKKIISNSG